MKRFTKVLIASACAFMLHCGLAQAQGGPGMGNMDPQQIQQMMQERILANFRQQLSVTNDAEWTIIQDRLSKVSRLRMEALFTVASGMMPGMRGGGGGVGGPGGGGRGMGGLFQQDANTETLQKCIDNNSPASQLKDALTRLRNSRKQKLAELAKAEADLRTVLTLRQEAILVAAGMLE